MFQQSETIRKLNMKIAGTLQQQMPEKKQKQNGNQQSSLYADVSFEGMTAKQKKRLKKKLLKKRKKLERSQNTSNLNISRSTDGGLGEDDDDDEKDKDVENDQEADLDINIDDVAIGGGKPTAAAKNGQSKDKKKATTDSLNRGEDTDKGQFDDLLGTSAENKEKSQEAQDQKEEESKRGPKIGNDVQVKICDMGNGCWTYHHFTPEI